VKVLAFASCLLLVCVSGVAAQECRASWASDSSFRAALATELGPAVDRARLLECRETQATLELDGRAETFELGSVQPSARIRLLALLASNALLAPSAELPRADPDERDSADSPEPSEPQPVEDSAASSSYPLGDPATGRATHEGEPRGEEPLDEELDTPALGEHPPPSLVLSPPDRLPRKARPWELTSTLGVRVFVAPLAPVGDATLRVRWDRLLLFLSGSGTRGDGQLGSVHFAQLALGIGAQLLDYHGGFDVRWNVRGDVGALVLFPEVHPDLKGRVQAETEATYMLAASSSVELTFPVDRAQMGAQLEVGYERGAIDWNELDSDFGISGFFVGASLVVGGAL
jgi:hypothetical protein